MNIVLTGLRAAGKTTIGKMLAMELVMPFYDVDAEVEKRAGRKISEIVQGQGWSNFRALEADVCADLAKLDGIVIACGGGSIISPENAKNLKRNGKVFYLQRELKYCLKWIVGDKNRPSLDLTEDPALELQKTFLERKPIYEATADHIIICEGENYAHDLKVILKIIADAHLF